MVLFCHTYPFAAAWTEQFNIYHALLLGLVSLFYYYLPILNPAFLLLHRVTASASHTAAINTLHCSAPTACYWFRVHYLSTRLPTTLVLVLLPRSLFRVPHVPPQHACCAYFTGASHCSPCLLFVHCINLVLLGLVLLFQNSFVHIPPDSSPTTLPFSMRATCLHRITFACHTITTYWFQFLCCLPAHRLFAAFRRFTPGTIAAVSPQQVSLLRHFYLPAHCCAGWFSRMRSPARGTAPSPAAGSCVLSLPPSAALANMRIRRRGALVLGCARFAPASAAVLPHLVHAKGTLLPCHYHRYARLMPVLHTPPCYAAAHHRACANAGTILLFLPAGLRIWFLRALVSLPAPYACLHHGSVITFLPSACHTGVGMELRFLPWTVCCYHGSCIARRALLFSGCLPFTFWHLFCALLGSPLRVRLFYLPLIHGSTPAFGFAFVCAFAALPHTYRTPSAAFAFRRYCHACC